MTEPTTGKGLTDEEQQLWDTWRQHRRQEDRLRLYEHYAPWMRKLAGHYAKSPTALAEWGDYVSLGAEGLLKAIDRYAPVTGVRFQYYAEKYIHGAISRGLQCYRKDKRATDTDRVAHHLPLPKDREAAIEALRNAAVDLAFGYFLETGVTDEEQPQKLDPYALHQQKQHVDYLAIYVEQLPEREKQLIKMHYFDQLSFSEIAGAMGVSKPRVTQLHVQAVGRIRRWFMDMEKRE